jgi:hypothetical protein
LTEEVSTAAKVAPSAEQAAQKPSASSLFVRFLTDRQDAPQSEEIEIEFDAPNPNDQDVFAKIAIRVVPAPDVEMNTGGVSG